MYVCKYIHAKACPFEQAARVEQCLLTLLAAKTMMSASILCTPQLAKKLKLLFLDIAAFAKPRLCFGVRLRSAGRRLLIRSTCRVRFSEAQAELKSLAMHWEVLAGRTTVGTVACSTISHPDQWRMFFYYYYFGSSGVLFLAFIEAIILK